MADPPATCVQLRIVSAESTCSKRYSCKSLVTCSLNERIEEVYHISQLSDMPWMMIFYYGITLIL